MAHIYLASPHMSEEGYEQQYVKEAFDTNWIAPLGKRKNWQHMWERRRQQHYPQALQPCIWH